MPDAGLIVTEADGATVVDFRNVPALDSAGVKAIEAEMYGLVAERKRTRILLDFSAVRFLASQMLGTLVAMHKKAAEAGGKVIICGLSANLYRVFKISRLDTALYFAPSVADGLVAFDSPGRGGADDGSSDRGWKSIVNKQIRIFFAGALVLVPLAITVWVVWSLGAWLDDLGRRGFQGLGTNIEPWPGTGALILVAVIYLIGLLTHLWVFSGFFRLLERLVTNLPGAKTIYESVRDLMKLFGGGSRRMGRVVQYNVPGTDMSFLAILTNENPLGLPDDDPNRKVAVFMPLSYMIGGPTVLVSAQHIVEVDMTVEQCMKRCATAQVGSSPMISPPGAARRSPAAPPKKGLQTEKRSS